MTPQEAEMYLLLRMAPAVSAKSFIIADGAAYIATVDTLLKILVSSKFSYNLKNIWNCDSVSSNGISLVPVAVGDTTNRISLKSIRELMDLTTYPFAIAAKRFRGYILKPYKTRTEISGVSCVKISVKPNPDENDEDSPLTGNFYMSDDEEHRIIRMEHNVERSGVKQLVRWDFKSLGKFDFPYRVSASIDGEMCGFPMNSMIRAYFADIAFFPLDINQSPSKQE